MLRPAASGREPGPRRLASLGHRRGPGSPSACPRRPGGTTRSQAPSLATGAAAFVRRAPLHRGLRARGCCNTMVAFVSSAPGGGRRPPPLAAGRAGATSIGGPLAGGRPPRSAAARRPPRGGAAPPGRRPLAVPNVSLRFRRGRRLSSAGAVARRGTRAGGSPALRLIGSWCRVLSASHAADAVRGVGGRGGPAGAPSSGLHLIYGRCSTGVVSPRRLPWLWYVTVR